MIDITVAAQTQNFLLALGFGFLLGALYDMFRLLRMTFFSRAAWVFIQDVAYFSLAAVFSFMFILTVNYGEIRVYLLAGEALGWLIYHFSIGEIVMRVSKFAIKGIKFVLKWLFKIISAPLKFLYSIISRLFTRFARVFKKNLKKSAKNSKFYLKKNKVMVYNLLKVNRQKNKKRKSQSKEVRG